MFKAQLPLTMSLNLPPRAVDALHGRTPLSGLTYLCKLDGVLDEQPLGTSRLVADDGHAFVEALEDARDDDHHSGADLGQHGRHVLRGIAEVDAHSVQRVEVDRHALEHVRDRQYREAAVLFPVHVVELEEVLDLHQHVPVRELHALRGSHGTARVDDAEKVVGAYRLDLVVHPAEIPVRFCEFLALVDEGVPVDGVFGELGIGIDADDQLELRKEFLERSFQLGDGIHEQDLDVGILALELEIF